MSKQIHHSLRGGALSLFLTVFLTACAGLPAAPPQLVKSTEYRYLPVPGADTEPCPGPAYRPATNNDLLRHDGEERAARLCDEAQLSKIAGEQGKAPGTAAPPAGSSQAPAAATGPGKPEAVPPRRSQALTDRRGFPYPD